MYDITKDPDYANVYSKLPKELPGDKELAEERKFFMSHAEDLMMQLTFFQKEVIYHKDTFIIDADFIVTTIVRLMDTQIDHTGYERLKVLA